MTQETGTEDYRYVFGPVMSRRLGRSLGIDLTPSKTCCYNCLYCQLGPTAHPLTERREWVPTDDVLAEIRRWFAEDGEADVVTFAGSGEPTLHSGLGRVIDGIRQNTDLPVVVLSSGVQAFDPAVRADLARADIVKFTVGAPDAPTWRRLHRPAAALCFEDMIDGMRKFRKEFAGQLWAEVMLLAGINDSPAQIEGLAAICREIGADRVQLNSPVRPPADPRRALALPPQRLGEILPLFPQPAEIIGAVHSQRHSHGPLSDRAIVGLLLRHPCSIEDLAFSFGESTEQIQPHIDRLVAEGRVRVVPSEQGNWFAVGEDPGKAS